MRKIFTIAIFATLFPSLLTGQEKAKTAITDQYDRNGIALVLVEYNDNYQPNIGSWFWDMKQSDKYDLNDIPQKYLQPGYGRGTSSGRSTAISRKVAEADFGKQIISWLYSRDQTTGRMNQSRIIDRGHYNATERDLIEAESTKVGRDALGDVGFKLIANNYVLVVDYWSIKRSTENKKITYTVAADGYLYKINYNEEIEAGIYENWIYPEDTPEIAHAKGEAYEKMAIGVTPVMTVSTSQSYEEEDGGLRAAIVAAYGKLIFELEKGNEDWLVKASINSRKPLRAKIGTKEGVKNGMRYDVYRYSMDKAGRVVSTRRGVVRATTVAVNSRVAERDSPSSEFYQIAGRNASEGMILRQKNDLGLGLSVGYRVGGMSGINVKLDYLAGIKTNGSSQYVLLDFSGNAYRPQKYYEEHNLTSETEIPTLITALDIGIGYGYGFRATRFFEVVPHAIVGWAMLLSENDLDEALDSDDSSDEDEKLTDKSGVSLTAGIKFNINVYYPVQIFAGADASVTFGLHDAYTRNNEFLKQMNKQRNGIGVYAGVRINF